MSQRALVGSDRGNGPTVELGSNASDTPKSDDLASYSVGLDRQRLELRLVRHGRRSGVDCDGVRFGSLGARLDHETAGLEPFPTFEEGLQS